MSTVHNQQLVVQEFYALFLCLFYLRNLFAVDTYCEQLSFVHCIEQYFRLQLYGKEVMMYDPFVCSNVLLKHRSECSQINIENCEVCFCKFFFTNLHFMSANKFFCSLSLIHLIVNIVLCCRFSSFCLLSVRWR